MGNYISGQSDYELVNTPGAYTSSITNSMALPRRTWSAMPVDAYCEKQCVIQTAVHREAVTCITSIRPGIIVTGGRDSLVALTNIDTGECVRKWEGHEKEVTRVAYRSAGGKNILLSGSRDCTIRQWSFKPPETTRVMEGHQFVVTGLQILSDGRFVSGSRDNSVRLWDIETGKCTINRTQPRNMVTFIARAKTDSLIAQTSEDKELKFVSETQLDSAVCSCSEVAVRLWDPRDLNLIHSFPKKNQIQLHCDISHDERYCLSSSNGFNGDGCEITLWDLRQRSLLREFRGHEESVNCAIFMKQQVTWKNLVLSVSNDHSVRVWNMDDGC